ncbi:MAG: hypothetical protein ACOXZ9_02465 [Bacteroidales bacterium]|jgi:hypothetical protein
MPDTVHYRTIDYRFTADFFASFSVSHVINKLASNEPGNIYLYYNTTVTNNIKYNKFSIDTYFYTDFGTKKYFDSISVISENQYNFRNAFLYQIGESKILFNMVLDIKSQFFRQYTYTNDSLGNTTKQLYSSYFSPGYRGFSGGLSYVHKKFSVNLGLVNGMKTIVRNQKLYDERKTDNLYGVAKGEKSSLDFGLNLIFTLPVTKIAKNFYVENNSMFRVTNKNLGHLNRYCFDINNAFHYVFLKNFRISLRSKFMYDYQISDKINIVNNISLGFYFNNTF